MAILNNTGIRGGASAATSGSDTFKVKRSAKFNATDSAYLDWTPTTKSFACGAETGCRNFTISFWTKVEGDQFNTRAWCGCGSSSQINGILQFYIEYGKVTINTVNAYQQSTRVLRDPAAWYHIVLAVDTDAATDSDRFKVWVNNERITDWGSSPSYPYQGLPMLWNTNVHHTIGSIKNSSGSNSSFLDGYLTEFYNIDGQTLDPSYFGETNDNGKWVPKEYTGTYGFQVDNSVDWSGNNDASDGPVSTSTNTWYSGHTAEQLFTWDPNVAGVVYAGATGNSVTWEPESTYTFTDKVEIRCTTAVSQTARITYSDDTYDDTTITSALTWVTIATGGGVVKSIRLQAPSGDWSYWNAIRIDGKVLVDSVHTTITDNSCYLKFDESGVNYTSMVDGSDYSATYDRDNMFDGDPTGYAYLAGDSSDVVFTPTGGLAFDTSLKVKVLDNGGGSMEFKWDGGSYTLSPTSDQWYDVSSNVTSPVTSIEWTTAAAAAGPYIYAWEVDGAQLIDLNDWEVDSSGKGNHVKSYNLSKLNGQKYSLGGDNTNMYSGGTWDLAFDGSTSTGAFTYSTVSVTCTIPTPVKWEHTFEVYALEYDGHLKVNDLDCTSLITEDTTPQWYNLNSVVGNSGTFKSITISDVGTNYVKLHAVRLDGTILVDGAGTINDSQIDVPNDYDDEGRGAGNYATWNPLRSNGVFTDGNLSVQSAANSVYHTHATTLGMTSGKWYCEITNHGTGTNNAYGIINSETNTNTYLGATTGTDSSMGLWDNGGTYRNSAYTNSTYCSAFQTGGETVGMAFDVDNGTLKFYVSGDDEGNAWTDIPQDTWHFCVTTYETATTSIRLNCGQHPFTFDPPEGYKALNTYNLTEPTIKDPSEYFDVSTWTADDEDSKTIDGLNFQPDMVWGKNRTSGVNHQIFDAVRGAGSGKELTPNLTKEEGNTTDPKTETYGFLSAFNSDGFTVAKGDDSTGYQNYYWNYLTNKHVAWCWNAGGTTDSVSAGGLNSTIYDQSQTWSDSVTNPSGAYGVAANAFDGDLTTHASPNYANPMTYTNPSPSDTVIQTFEVKCDIYTMTGITVELNDTDITSQLTTTDKWHTITGFTDEQFQKFYWRPTSANYEVKIKAIRINGKILVDDDVTPTSVPTLPSTYRANPSAGFSIVTYTGNATSGATIAHGLNAKPSFGMFKARETDGYSWYVYHKNLGNTHHLYLEGPYAQNDDSGAWNDTDPDSNVMTLGNATPNPSGEDMVAYIWSEVEGYSKFGQYEGTANGDTSLGAFIYCGFKPAWILVKNIDASEDFLIWDTERDGYNPTYQYFEVNDTDAENETTNDSAIDITSTGFKIRVQYQPNNANTYVYAAFAETPLKYANAH